MLNAKDIHLRTIEPYDLDFLFQLENNTENWKISNTKVPFSKEILTQYINSAQDIFISNQIRFVICSNTTNKQIGTIDLFEYDPLNQRAGIGIIILKQYRGKSYASQALKIAIKYCFDHLFLHSIYCNILESNKASINLFSKYGFTEQGKKIDWIKNQNGWENELFFQKNN